MLLEVHNSSSCSPIPLEKGSQFLTHCEKVSFSRFASQTCR
ncbi:hypothetical protein HMPREF9069_01162 [Atopobium sp. oral taxon 810 str. F0209]|nr:hypothetical protein HMPREF9069_01162 [Atopobium sp. oral taxon 810 str. F0209]